MSAGRGAERSGHPFPRRGSPAQGAGAAAPTRNFRSASGVGGTRWRRRRRLGGAAGPGDRLEKGDAGGSRGPAHTEPAREEPRAPACVFNPGSLGARRAGPAARKFPRVLGPRTLGADHPGKGKAAWGVWGAKFGVPSLGVPGVRAPCQSLRCVPACVRAGSWGL